VDAHFALHGAQQPKRSLGMGEAVEAAGGAIGIADAVDRDVDLPEDLASLGGALVEAEAAGGQVRGDADRASVLRDGEEMVQLPHHLPVDVQQRARAGELDDAAELLGPRPRHLHFCSPRKSAPRKSAIMLAQIEPKRRKVTSTPSELEFGLQPKVACRTRPRR